MKLNVMTYNVASGHSFLTDEEFNRPEGLKIDLSQCAGVIREVGPDICGINEINRFEPGYTQRAGARFSPDDQTGYLAEASGLGNGYFGKAIHFENRGDYGNSVLSRFPILEADVIPIPDPEVYDEEKYYETRAITRVKLDVPGGLTVLQVHVGLAIAESQNAVVTLCKVLDETEGPVILMGDFNMCPNNFLLDRLRQGVSIDCLDAAERTAMLPLLEIGVLRVENGCFLTQTVQEKKQIQKALLYPVLCLE